MKNKITAALVAVATVLGLQFMLAPGAWAWSCSDGVCKALSHRQPDDGYDNAFLVQCGINNIQYSIGEGQSSQAIGCNDVNNIYMRSGHSLNCYINGTWIEVYENAGPSGYWRPFSYGGNQTSLLCVDAWYGTIAGGGGGGGGGGGTW
jgi:hypothetical protein